MLDICTKVEGIDLIIDCAQKIQDVTFHIVGGTKKDIEYWKNYTKHFKSKKYFFMDLYHLVKHINIIMHSMLC